MRSWRIITALFLLLLVAVPLIFLSALQLRQWHIRHTLEERLEAGLPKTFFVPKNNWQPLNSHEILLHKKLFDLKQVQEQASGYLVTGVFDEDETAVVQQIANTCQQKNAKEDPVFAQFFHLLQGLFLQPESALPAIAASSVKLFQNPIVPLPLFYRQIISPPPQSLL
jgi:hypothetical protein